MPYIQEENSNPSIYYETIGNGTPLILIPPPGIGHLVFRYQLSLMDVCKLITFDIRGDGQSGRSPEPMTMEQLAYDVKRVLDTNGINKGVICGYSNGASIAQEFALSYPERTDGLILIGSYYEVRSFLLEMEYQIGIWAAQKEFMTILASVLAKNHFSDTKASKELYKEIIQSDPHMLAQQYQVGLSYSSADRLHKINVPILLMYGSRDYYLQNYQHFFRKVVRDIEVVYISGVKHQVPTKAPHACNALIRGWLKRKDLIFSPNK
ncbi:pimeloyl-ACP methyl ester carboxylesterase [Evansella vedderi]|uniref:Pimeloyl-ACP methyl ester carboxylesterase n=1 Tax=Evansella vedderi TaxID=38282 RepID=A0ABT9ZU57_9BACI|nr:alpha/beta hydrolase [Evansella vedderi]MDQ0254776.1 pimeloyl-ACP methyl ester carboxylesterase [Evansella vedderi]